MAHLLLVDDDNDLVQVFGALLRTEGHDVRTASTGEEGLTVLRAAPLADVVVDMPILGGPGMAHQMLLHDAGEEKIPVILVSGRVDLAQIARRMETTYFVQKPADFGKFLSVLGQALTERLAPSSA